MQILLIFRTPASQIWMGGVVPWSLFYVCHSFLRRRQNETTPKLPSGKPGKKNLLKNHLTREPRPIRESDSTEIWVTSARWRYWAYHSAANRYKVGANFRRSTRAVAPILGPKLFSEHDDAVSNAFVGISQILSLHFIMRTQYRHLTLNKPLQSRGQKQLSKAIWLRLPISQSSLFVSCNYLSG